MHTGGFYAIYMRPTAPAKREPSLDLAWTESAPERHTDAAVFGARMSMPGMW